MKVLFATSKYPDYISVQLWDGLQSILGKENVVDAANNFTLHQENTGDQLGNIARQGEVLGDRHGRDFDLLVINACFMLHNDWQWINRLVAERLKPGARIAYVEGWDGAGEIWEPPIHVDHVFRREIDPAVTYPYSPITPLQMSAPLRWFCEPKKKMTERPLDITCLFHWNSSPIRWQCYQRVFEIDHHDKFIIAGGSLPYSMYRYCLENAKLCICPPGAGNCSDTMRIYEAVASGIIPVFVGHPYRMRGAWFAEDHAFFCPHPSDVPGTLSRILFTNDFDLQVMSDRLVQHGRTHHTTIARAATLLKHTMGVESWELSESLKKRIANVCS